MFIVVLMAPLRPVSADATMAGILFIVAYGLWDSHHIKQIIRTSYSDTAVLAATFGAALALELDKAIFVGVLLSLLLYLRQTSNPQIHIRVPDPRTIQGNSPTRATICRNASRCAWSASTALCSSAR